VKHASALLTALPILLFFAVSCGGTESITAPEEQVDAASPAKADARESLPAPASPVTSDSLSPTDAPLPPPSPRAAPTGMAHTPLPRSAAVEDNALEGQVAPQASMLYFWAAW
jgi:hypothetical protein